MGTIAFLTVLINGGTTKALLRALGLLSYTPEQLATLQARACTLARSRARALARLRACALARAPRLRPARKSPAANSEKRNSNTRKFKRAQHVVDDMEDIRRRRLEGLAPDDVLGDAQPGAVEVRGRPAIP